MWTQRDRAGSATYELILLHLAGMSKSVLDFVISIQNWSDLEGNQVELVSQKKEFLFWDQFRLLVIKGNQKGKVTCYARERVNKNELF